MDIRILENQLNKILNDYDLKIDDAWDDPTISSRLSFKAVQLAKQTHDTLTEFKDAIIEYLKTV